MVCWRHKGHVVACGSRRGLLQLLRLLGLLAGALELCRRILIYFRGLLFAVRGCGRLRGRVAPLVTGSEGLLRRRAGAQRRAGAAGEDIRRRWRSSEGVCRAGDSANSGREHGQLGGGVLGMTMVLMRLKGRLSGLAAGAPRADVSPIGTSTGSRHPSREHCTCQKREAVESTVNVHGYLPRSRDKMSVSGLDHIPHIFQWCLSLEYCG